MQSDKIRATDALCRQHWTYRVNSVSQWRSYGDSVVGERPWSGDCADMTSTVLDILGRLGSPLSARFRLLVSTTGDPTPNHMVGAAVADDGSWWIVGDTVEGVTGAYAVGGFGYRACEYNRLDEIDANYQPTWRIGLPWSAP